MNAAEVPRAATLRADEGFSLVELVIALSVLSISLVALLGLANTSSFLVQTSRQRAAMVNAAASYLERVRQTPFSSVGVPGGDPAGTLVSETTTGTQYVITVTPSVAWGRPEDPTNHSLKTVTLRVDSAALSGGSRNSMGAAAILADIGDIGAPVVTSVATPTASFTTPGNGAVVWGTPLSVTVTAAVGVPSRLLVWLDVIDGVQSWGSASVTGTNAQHTWSWNTVAAREGKHRLTPRVTDNGGSTSDGTSITVTVDNAPPTVPGSPAGSFTSGVGANMWWSAATDGTDVDGVTALPASHYVATFYRQPVALASAGDYTVWSPVTGATGLSIVNVPTAAAPLAISGLAGFSRYAGAVVSSSPDRGASSGLVSAAATIVGVTESTAQGTWGVTVSGTKYTVTSIVNVPTGPSFPWSGTATTRFYRLTSAGQSATSGTLVGTVSSTYPTWSTAAVTDVQTVTGAPGSWYYVAVTTLTPVGYGSASTTVKSGVLAPPADRSTTGTRQLVFAQW